VTRRLLYDVTGLLHWYAYFRRPAGVQRVIEKIGASDALQSAARSRQGQRSVEFVVRLVGTARFCRLDPSLLIDLNEARARTVPMLRRRFAESLVRSPPRGLLADGRYFHVPYLLAGLATLWSKRLAPLDPPTKHDAYFSPGDLWWQRGYARALSDLKKSTGARLLQVVFDFHVEERRDWSPLGFSRVFSRELRGIAPHVDHWIAGSDTVAGQLTRRLGDWSVPPRPISAWRYGWDTFASPGLDAASDDSTLERLGVGHRPYILFVGTIEPRKNIGSLLDALEWVRESLGERVPPLVIAGGYGWRAGALRRRIAEKIRDGHAHWIRDADDAALAALYRRARFSVMPSLGEGYGLAIQESLGHGTPCIASDREAMREAGGRLARYFDPRRHESLRDALLDWIGDQAAVDTARAGIRDWLDYSRLPSWNEAGEALLRYAFDG